MRDVHRRVVSAAYNGQQSDADFFVSFLNGLRLKKVYVICPKRHLPVGEKLTDKVQATWSMQESLRSTVSTNRQLQLKVEKLITRELRTGVNRASHSGPQ